MWFQDGGGALFPSSIHQNWMYVIFPIGLGYPLYLSYYRIDIAIPIVVK